MTHPFHPLCGRVLELASRRRLWGEERVYYIDEAGELRGLPSQWTDRMAADPFVAVSAGRALFRADDLLRLGALILGERP